MNIKPHLLTVSGLLLLSAAWKCEDLYLHRVQGFFSPPAGDATVLLIKDNVKDKLESQLPVCVELSGCKLQVTFHTLPVW